MPLSAIQRAASQHGVDPETLRIIAQLESNMNPAAKNPRSSAGGLFQFIDSTAWGYGLQDRYDPYQASDAAARLLLDNQRYLSNSLGRTPTPGELYLAHQQGMGGAAQLLSNPNRKAVDVLSPDVIRLNVPSGTDWRNITAGEFANLWIDKANRVGGIPASGIQMGSTPLNGLPPERPASLNQSASPAVNAYNERLQIAQNPQLYDPLSDPAHRPMTTADRVNRMLDNLDVTSPRATIATATAPDAELDEKGAPKPPARPSVFGDAMAEGSYNFANSPLGMILNGNFDFSKTPIGGLFSNIGDFFSGGGTPSANSIRLGGGGGMFPGMNLGGMFTNRTMEATPFMSDSPGMRRSTPVTMASNSGGYTPGYLNSNRDNSFDQTYHSGMNMDVYRANQEAVYQATGSRTMNQDTINQALSSGATLVKAR